MHSRSGAGCGAELLNEGINKRSPVDVAQIDEKSLKPTVRRLRLALPRDQKDKEL